MANNQTQPYPTPPPFFKSFTADNLEQLHKLRKTATRDGKELDILALPPELRYLIPPAPPEAGEWRTFSEMHHDPPQEASLEAAGIEQLYPHDADAKLNPQPHLIALARSLLTTFLALMGVLSRNPEHFMDRAQDLQTIAFNAHDLINAYRPHQARESLIYLMESRIETMREEIKKINEEKEKVGGLLGNLVEGEKQEVKDERMDDVKHDERGGGVPSNNWQKGAWAAIEQDLDGMENGGG